MTSHLSRSCSRRVICDVSCTWARPPGATTMRRLLSTTALSTTAALALGLSGCFPSAPAPSSVSVSSASSVPSASDARRPPSVAPAASASPAVGRPAVKTTLPKRTFTFQGMTSQYAVYADHLAGKRPKGVLFRLHGDGFPNSRARTACASSRLLDRRRVRRRRRICRGAAHIPRHRNETCKPRVRSRQRPQRLNPLGGGHAPKNIRGRKRPRRSLPG